jgi:molybdenum cofactor cytidylyltransferase
MSGGSKLLLALGGETVAARAVRSALEYCDPLIVVTGKDESLLRKSLERSGFSDERLIFVHNPRWAGGRVSSLRAGMRALEKTREGFFLAHADMPFIDPDVYLALNQAAAARKAALLPPALIFPTINGKPGHPVFFPIAFAPILAAVRAAESLKEAVSGLAREYIETDCEGTVEDIDSPEDYDRLCRKYGLAGSGLQSDKAV